MNRENKITLLIAILVLSFLIVIFVIIPSYLYRQSDDLLTITYTCMFNIKPSGFSAWKTFENDTHMINMDSCKWIKKEMSRELEP